MTYENHHSWSPRITLTFFRLMDSKCSFLKHHPHPTLEWNSNKSTPSKSGNVWGSHGFPSDGVVGCDHFFYPSNRLLTPAVIYSIKQYVACRCTYVYINMYNMYVKNKYIYIYIHSSHTWILYVFFCLSVSVSKRGGEEMSKRWFAGMKEWKFTPPATEIIASGKWLLWEGGPFPRFIQQKSSELNAHTTGPLAEVGWCEVGLFRLSSRNS